MPAEIAAIERLLKAGKSKVRRNRIWEQICAENGGLMPYWADLQLPESWQDSVILYRGHRENARSVAEIGRNQPAQKLAWFYDFDPAGQALALDQAKGSTLVPEKWQEFGCHTPFNQPKTYRKHSAALRRLKARASGEFLAIAEHMEDEELALMQEHMVLRRVPLITLAIVPNS